MVVVCTWVCGPCDGQIEVEAYIPNFGSNNVSVINTATNTVVGSPIAVGSNPIGVATTPDGRYVYVANISSNTVSVINLATNTVVGSPIAVGASPEGAAVTPNGGFVYVVNSSSNTVSVINTATNTVVGSPISVGAHPSGVAITPNGSFAYVTNQNSNTVSVINTATNTVVGSPIPVQSSPSETAVTPNGMFVYVTNNGSASVSVISTATNTVVATIAVGTNPNAIAITPNGNFVYVDNTGSGTVSVINTTTNTIVASIPVPIRASAGGIAITPNGGFAYVTNFAQNTVTVISTATNTVVGSPIPVGTEPFAEGLFVSPNIIVAAGGPLSIANDAALTPLGFGQFVDFNGGTLLTTGSLVTARTISLLALGGTIDTNGFNSTLSGNIINSGSLTKIDSGTLTLTGTNTYTGGTNLNGGVLAVNNDGNLGTGALSFNGGALEALAAGGGITSSKVVTLNAGGGTFLADAGTTSTLSGAISGIGSLTMSGSGTLVLTAMNSYSGGTSLNGGILAVNSDTNLGTGALSFGGGTLEALAVGGGIISSKAVTLNAGGGTFSADAGTTSTLSGAIGGVGSFTTNGPGTLILAGANTYSGATNVALGTLQAGSTTGLSSNSTFNVSSLLDLHGFNSTIGSLSGTGTVTNSAASPATLTAGGDNTSTTFSGSLTNGTGSLGFTKTGNGTMILTGASTYTGGTTINAGELQIGNGSTTGSIVGNVTNNAALVFDRPDNVTFNGVISGTGSLTQSGTGTLDLTGTNSYSGNTNVNAGTLLVDGSLGTGSVNVVTGATLGGTGTIGGPVTIQNGGILAPGDNPGTLTVGSLTLNSGSISNYQLGTPNVIGSGINDLVIVNGNLTLAGSLNVANAGGFGSGVYRLFNYTGSLTNDGLTLNMVPSGFTAADFLVQTTQAGEVNLLVSASGFVNQYWDGPNTVADGTIHGGTGTWDNVTTNWTNADATVNAPWQSGVAIFEGTAGTVTLGDNIQFSGMEFMSDGYTIVAPGAQTLIAAATTTIDVGSGLGATIAAPIVDGSSPAAITKTDLGTLILTGTNTYTGGTTIAAGTLQIGNGGTSGSIVGDVTDNGALVFDRSDSVIFNGTISGTGSVTQNGTGSLTLSAANSYSGGTNLNAGILAVISDEDLGTGSLSFNGGTLEALAAGAGIISSKAVTLNADGGTFLADAGTTSTLSGVISGSGSLTQSGSGSLILTGTNTYTGGTTITDGTLQIGNGGTTGSIVGNVIDNAVLVFDRSDSLTFSGTIAGTGSLTQSGSGSLILTGTNTYTGGTTITAGALQIGNGSTTGSIVGNVTNNAALVFDRSDNVTFSGTISGTGSLTQSGSGALILSGTNSYSGNTNVNAGTLRVDGSLGAGSVNVVSGATLGGTGTIGGPVTIQNGGVLAPGDSPGTLTVGTLTLNSGSISNYQLGTPNVIGSGVNDLVIVNGNLTLAGLLNVANAGGFGSGVYRLFNYTGSLTNDGLTLNTVPSGFTSGDFLVQTTQAGEVNLLVSASGFVNQYWDGPNTVADGVIHGGTGTWNNVTTNWTNADATVNAPWQSGVAVFEGTAGTVTLGDNIQFSGMQFMTDGYIIVAPGSQTLIAAPATTIDVGSGFSATISAPIVDGSSPAAITKTDSGTLILTGTNTYTGGTTIAGGTLQIGNGGATGSIVGDVVDNGALVFDRSDSVTFNGTISGTGNLTQNGAGSLILNGTNTYSGSTNVDAGTFRVDGSLGAGSVNVLSGATLGGTGTIGGPVTIQNGGILAPGDSPGTLTMGTLTLNSGSISNYELGTPNVIGSGVNDLVIVNGNLTLAGTLNVANAGGFGSGVYRLFNYSGSLTNNGLTLNMVPAGFTPAYFLVQTTQPGEVNLLVSTSPFIAQYWDGPNTVADGMIHGGTGTWNNVTTNWTIAAATVNAPWQNGFAIFEGTAGTVTLGADIQLIGMQFVTNGYTIVAPGAQTLIGAPTTIFQVGPGATATIAVPIVDGSSPAGLTKTDPGTLILTGTNTYTGGTTIAQGTLQIGNGGTTGTIVGNVTDNASLEFDRSDPVTFSGTVSGTGSLTQSGGGALTLTGSNTYTGGTTIAAGTLQLGNGSVSGSIVGAVVNNSIFDMFNANTAGITAITTSNGGVTNFENATTAGTATIVNNTAGTTSFFNMSTAGNASITNGMDGATIFHDTSTAGNATIINGIDGLTTFTDMSTAGNAAITNNGGTTQFQGISTAGNATITTNNGGQTQFDDMSTGGQARLITNAGGTVDISGLTNSGMTAGSIEGAGTYALGSKTLTVGLNNLSTLVSGTITDGGLSGGTGGALIKDGTGALTLSGSDSYSGGTVLNAGTLIVNNARALGLGNVVVNGGILTADPQPINVKENYTQNTGSTLQLQVAGANPGQYDTLIVGGNAALGGTLQLLSLGFHPEAGNRLTLVSTGGVVTNRFAQFVDPFATGAGYNTVDLVYGLNSVVLEFLNLTSPVPPGVVAINFESYARTPDERAAAKILDDIELDPKAANLLSFLDKEPVSNLPGDLDKISPEGLSAFYEISFSNANIQRLNLEGRLDDVRAGSNGFSSNMKINSATVNLEDKAAAESSKSPVEPVLQPGPENRWGVWVTGFGDFVDVDSDYNAEGYDFTTGGVSVGIDYRLTDQLAVGVMGEYSHTWTNLKPRGDIDVDSGRGGVYGTWFNHGLYVNGAIYGGHNVYDSSRATLGGSANGGTGGAEFSTSVSAGYDCHVGQLTAGPVASLQYTYVSINDFIENGSLAPLEIHSQSAESLRTDFGFRASYLWQVGKVFVEPSLRAAWEHEYKYSALPITAGFAGISGPSATFYGPSEGHDSAIVSAGLSVQWTLTIATYLNYDGQLGRSRYDSNAVTGGVRIGF